MSSCVIRPLMRNTTKSLSAVSRSIRQAIAPPTVRDRKRRSTRKLMKWDVIQDAVTGESRGSREAREFSEYRERRGSFRQT